MRARWLKPEFFKDKKIAQVGFFPALLYQALWCMADDGGTAPCDPEVIKGEMFMKWSEVGVLEITGALRVLYFAKRIKFFMGSDELFCEIVNFKKHQTVHKPSKFRNSLQYNDFRPVVPEWCSTSEEDSGTPHHLDTYTPRHLTINQSSEREIEVLGRFPNQWQRDAVKVFLVALPASQRRESWIEIVNGWLDGLGMPSMKPADPQDIATGLNEYGKNTDLRYDTPHIVGFITRAAGVRLGHSDRRSGDDRRKLSPADQMRENARKSLEITQ